MDFEWVAIALGDVVWISIAFALGLGAKTLGLPPMVGFLATGFVVNSLDVSSGDALQKLADLGITLLLFTVGLKLNLKTLARPQVWAVSALHMGIVVPLFGLGILGLSVIGLPFFTGLDWQLSLLLGFALSFSSTVYAVKVLEEKAQMKAFHGRIAIGILIMQDIAAVVFLAASTGKLPSPWALSLLLLLPLRPLLHRLLERIGHGELLILFGMVLALGGAELFEMVGVKDDLGALIIGLLISTHSKSKELAKSMLGFKDLFLVGFFLTIGMSGTLSFDAFMIGLLLVPVVLIKSALFFGLLSRFKLRARTSLLATLTLSNYSEFGLIVAAIGVSSGWLQAKWLIAIAVALSLSFVFSAILKRFDHAIYSNYRSLWLKFQSKERLPEDAVLETRGASIAVFGMGRVGSGAYDKMHQAYGDTVVGVDFDWEKIVYHQSAGRNVVRGDPCDTDFWEKLEQKHQINLVMLTLPKLRANLDALAQLRSIGYSGRIAATARYEDEVARLKQAGATDVFNIYTEAGAGSANHVLGDGQR